MVRAHQPRRLSHSCSIAAAKASAKSAAKTKVSPRLSSWDTSECCTLGAATCKPIHPHIHYVIPGGGVKLDCEGRADPLAWQSTTPKNFLMHHGTLITEYRDQADRKAFQDGRACTPMSIPEGNMEARSSLSTSKPVGHAEPTLKYLAPYVHRVAISDQADCVSWTIDSVTLYRSSLESSSREIIRRHRWSVLRPCRSPSTCLPSGLHEGPSLRMDECELADSKLDRSASGWCGCIWAGRIGWPAVIAPQPKPLVDSASLRRVWRWPDAGGGSDLGSRSTIDPSEQSSLNYFDSG